MVTMLVLSLFVAIGLLDTLHYRVALPDSGDGKTVYAAEVLSVLDVLVGDLRSHTEKTYSAPLAVYLYAKESMEMPDGRLLHLFPIAAGEGTTNVAFGPGERELYVTVVKDPNDPQARGSVVRIPNDE